MNGIDRFEESLDLAFWGAFYLLPVLPLLVYLVIYCGSLVGSRLRRVPVPVEASVEEPAAVAMPVGMAVPAMVFTSARPASS